ncbi:MAG: hypothetical protein ACRD3E_19145, partial [Terriglobales bacterium]
LKRYREDMVRNKQKSMTIEDQLKQFEDRLRHELRLAGSSSDRGGGCGTHAEQAPAELVSIEGMKQPANDLVEMAGD